VVSGPYRLAIDLGTCNTVAVVDRGNGVPRALLFDGSPLLPSATFVDRGGATYVGRDAERLMITDPARFEPYPKSRIDEHAVLLGDREVAVPDLLAAVLRRVAAEAAQAGTPAGGHTVLTCPADWGPRRRAVLAGAAEVAGLGRVTLVDEPVAAATYCLEVLGQRVADGRCVAVFDFGGGTLDVTVVQRDPAGLRVLATGGLDDLGGTDVDAALVGHLGQLAAITAAPLWQRIAQPHTTGELRDRRAFWSEVRAAKEMLSRAPAAPVHLPGSEQASHLTREELERVAGPLVDRAVDETRRVLQRSGVGPDRLDAILLVGGSSRLPLVASRLHARLGVAPVVPEQPELPVAHGALLLVRAPNRAPEHHPASPPQAPPPAQAQQPVQQLPPARGMPPFQPQPVQQLQPPALPVPAPPPQQAAQAPAGNPAPRRPGVIIGPGVTLQGNVAVYGDADLMPDDDDEDDEPDERAEVPEPAARRRRGGFGIGRRLWFLALPILPWVLIVALTPWGQDLYASVRDRIAGADQPTLTLSPESGPATTQVKLTVGRFQPNEQIDLYVDEIPLDVVNASADGTGTWTFTPKAKQLTKPGTLRLKAIGKTKTATADFKLTG
jgi:actin-like ATPase involved in cell morphogenesis